MHQGFNTIDGIYAVIIVLAAYAGWYRGCIGSVLGFLGSSIALILGTNIIPFLINKFHHDFEKSLSVPNAFLAAYVVLFILGYVVGAVVNRIIRGTRQGGILGIADHLSGAAIHGALAVVVLWLSLPIVGAVLPQSKPLIYQSFFHRWGESHAPQWLQEMPVRLQKSLDTFYRNTASRYSVSGAGTSPQFRANSRQYAASKSVVKIEAHAPECHKDMDGSGFIFDEHLIFTNAHVVAGASTIVVEDNDTPSNGVVVYFDPYLDVAVIYDEVIEEPALELGTVPPTPATPVAIGYPRGGNLTLIPQIFSQKTRIRSLNIYGAEETERLVQIFHGTIEPGSSGGPVVNSTGQVVAMIFGAEKTDNSITYGLDVQELKQLIGRDYAHSPVSTNKCISVAQ